MIFREINFKSHFASKVCRSERKRSRYQYCCQSRCSRPQTKNEFFSNEFNRKKIPDYLYISSTSTVKKGENAFEYEILSKNIEINNLSSDDTKSFLNTLNLVFKFGTSDDFNLMIASPFVNALIGNEENNGFAYSLKGLDVKDYDFVVVDEINYYVLKA